ncbi:MAG: DUF177 domain-containing protein [Acidiferrobacterales bacterium]
MPATIDPVKLTDAGARLSGDLPLKAMDRLRAMCVDDQAQACVVLQFERSGEPGLRRIWGDITITLHVACQRCLQPMSLVLDVHPSLIVVVPDQDSDLLARETDVVVADRPVRLARVVEDELLLAMPMIPMHDVGKCPSAAYLGKARHQERKDSPFSVLDRLKSKDWKQQH